MKTFKLNAEVRTVSGKKAVKGLRKEGLVPGVIYGGEKNISITVIDKDLRDLIYTPDIFLVEMNLGGEEKRCIVQEMQFHPVTDKLLHIDFLEVFPDKPMVIEVPVQLDGFPVGVRAGGKLTMDMRKIRVKGLYKDIPERLKIDVNKLQLGKTIQIGALSFENLEILNAKNAVVAAVRATRAAIGAVGSVDEEEETEGEEEKTEE
ncbi:50S ribosomal protein L25/general stress protein Ctc [Porphyromonadaceae bacterium W3.11]|nr:50S ribosomal protein L25/general stress protein Ctc [Porphyromonadaceae bacterium W3.11]